MFHERIPVPPDAEARRGGLRMDMEITAEVRVGTGKWLRASLLDVSRDGFRVGWMPHAEPGATIKIRIPGLEHLTAVIRWRRDNGVGCEFERPLGLYVFEHLMRAANG